MTSDDPSGPATGTARPGPASRRLPPRSFLADVPFHPQTPDAPDHCGPAVLASLLGAAGLPGTPASLAPQVYLPGRGGSLQVELLGAARRQGGVAQRLPPRLDALLAELADGRPVGVLLNLGLSWWTQWHYAVLVGHDLADESVRLHSGTQRAEVWPLATFEHTWTRAGAWALAVTRPGTLARTVTPDEAEAATLAFERLAAPPEALLAWSAVATRWPDRLAAALGAGNAAYALQDWPVAVRHFEAAAQRHDRAAAWNNLALARHRAGDAAGARAAAERALARAQADEPALLPAVRDTLAQLGR